MNDEPAFVAAVLRAVRWRTLLYAQMLGALFAITPWLEQWATATQTRLPLKSSEQALTAVFAVVAGLAGDEAVRRGWTVPRAFAAAMLFAGVGAAMSQWCAIRLLGFDDPLATSARLLTTFMYAASLWGPVLLAYLNRGSAARLLAMLRQGELVRVQAERRLVASHLAAADAQIDPDAVFGKLAQVRDLFVAGDERAEATLQALIDDLRATVARTA